MEFKNISIEIRLKSYLFKKHHKINYLEFHKKIVFQKLHQKNINVERD